VKIRIASDLHVEFWNNPNSKKLKRMLLNMIPELPDDKETILILAGDVGLAHKSETWATPLFYLSERFKNIIYCEGNHFFYGNDFFEDYPNSIKNPLPENVHLLENKSVLIDDVLFIGATLWSDMKIENREEAARISCSVERIINDYFMIKRKGYHFPNRLSTPHTHAKYVKSREFIFNELEKNLDKKSVVVTHHGPSFKSVPKRFEGDIINHAYVSDLDRFIKELKKPDFWIHGHTHDSVDYELGNTRVIVNPFGYLSMGENRNYKRKLVIEL